MIPFGLCISDYARRIFSSDGGKNFFPLIFQISGYEAI